MKYGLPASAIESISGVLSRYPEVSRAILYGSRAKGQYKSGSDIDLALIGDADLTLTSVYRILDEIDELLLPYTVDMSILSHISERELIEHIQRVSIVFFDRNAQSVAGTRTVSGIERLTR